MKNIEGISKKATPVRVHERRTTSPAFVTAPVISPIHQCRVTSDSMRLSEEVVLVLDAPCSSSERMLIEQIGKNLANVFAELARAKHDVS